MVINHLSKAQDNLSIMARMNHIYSWYEITKEINLNNKLRTQKLV